MPSELNASSQTNTQSSAIALYAIARQSIACPLNLMRRPKRLHQAYHVLCSMHRPKALRDRAQHAF